MKNTIKTVTLAVIALITFSFTTIETEKKEIKTDSSKVVWKGYKVTGSHEGTITLQSGSLSFEEEKLTGGEFVIDMTTIIVTDITGEYKGKLEGHLKSDDFFGTEKFATAILIFTEVKSKGKNSYTVTSDLTIKGKTNPVTFEISIYGNKATTSLKVDRTKYNIKYGSSSFFDGLKDKVIYDEFDLVVDLEF
ncbi:YceI family protein [uncultured Winogradskyella sp.]|jgi:polyisoprenoid-binding protein YceI|uniref:YceI family protein n=1 Tax=Olleya sp. TaxID=1906788 RepID=UPI0030ED6637|tara:strand:+ start:244 stop:819 length:576 start_codon:yes stop_codon:yes gene_type:complete